jgi:hypothetical protein
MTRTRLTLFAVLVLVAAPAFAQTNVTGDWDVTINSPQGANTMQVTFKQDGEKVSGTMKSQMGELPFDGGTITGSDLVFGFSVPVQGMSLDITMNGKVDGGSIAGTAKFGDFGEGEWTAKRSGAASAAPEAVAAPVAAAPAPAAPAPSAAASGTGINGKWDVMLRTPQGDFPANTTITEDGGKLSGTFGSQMGEVPLTGSLAGSAVKLSIVAQTPQGDLTVEMTGDLDGDSIVNGKADITGIGQLEWSAKRVKQ